jgi:dTDP-glucose 4,6-dehydratase
MANVLITGVGGFIGSHALEYFINKTDWNIIGVDSFRHKGTYSRIDEIENFDPLRVKVFYHDLIAPIDRHLENHILQRTLSGKEVQIDYIINFASDSAVGKSISDPIACWRNNCELMANMLEFARRIKPKVFLHISSDEVYGEADKTGLGHKEWDVILPHNVYSSSKAAQEALAISYWCSYDVPLILMNIMNPIGEKQDKERFLPKLIWKIATDQEMEIYGDVGNIGSRCYIHCKNIADALIFLSKTTPAMYGNDTKRPDRYNVVGDVELNNLEVAKYVAEILNKPLKYKLIPCDSARRGYDKRYALDGKKMKNLGWKHPISTHQAIKQVAEWTIQHPWWIL